MLGYFLQNSNLEGLDISTKYTQKIGEIKVKW